MYGRAVKRNRFQFGDENSNSQGSGEAESQGERIDASIRRTASGSNQQNRSRLEIEEAGQDRARVDEIEYLLDGINSQTVSSLFVSQSAAQLTRECVNEETQRVLRSHDCSRLLHKFLLSMPPRDGTTSTVENAKGVIFFLLSRNEANDCHFASPGCIHKLLSWLESAAPTSIEVSDDAVLSILSRDNLLRASLPELALRTLTSVCGRDQASCATVAASANGVRVLTQILSDCFAMRTNDQKKQEQFELVLTLLENITPLTPLTLDVPTASSLVHVLVHLLSLPEHEEWILSSLRILVNISNNNPPIAALVSDAGLQLVTQIVVDRHVDSFDVFALGLGLLINLVEACVNTRTTFGTITVVTKNNGRERQSLNAVQFFARLFHDTTKRLAQSAAATSSSSSQSSSQCSAAQTADNEPSFDEHQLAANLEENFLCSYTALLLGLVVQDNLENRAIVFGEVKSFGLLAGLLKEFVELQSEARLLTSEVCLSLGGVIRTLEELAAAETS